MTNLLAVLPDFDLNAYSHILPALEKACVSTADLVTLDALDVAKRAQVSADEVKKLAGAVLEGSHATLPPELNTAESNVRDVTLSAKDSSPTQLPAALSTLDDSLDVALRGGLSCGCLTEVVGESAAGKTQVLLTLLLSVQLPPPIGLGKSALYISTEAPLQTTRLNQILNSHPKLVSLQENERPSLSRIQGTHIHDVEAQEHILRYQVPVAISSQDIGLLVIDSVAANYRAESDHDNARRGAESFARRSTQAAQLGALLRQLAQAHNIVVVVANQVSDRFTAIEPSSQSINGSQVAQQLRPLITPEATGQRTTSSILEGACNVPSPFSPLSTDDPLALDHQQCFFTGWGDDISTLSLKTPSLGLPWTNQLAARIALLKDPIYEQRVYQAGEEREIAGWKRQFKVVFSSWCAESITPFEVWKGGVRSIEKVQVPGDTHRIHGR